MHAPRPTGKTTTLAALAQQLTGEGKHAAMLSSCETAEVAGDDYNAAELQVLDAIRQEAEFQLPPASLPPGPWPDAPPGRRIFDGPQAWAVKCLLPLVLFFDE